MSTERAKLCVTTATRVAASKSLIALHMQKKPVKHLRIRCQVVLTRSEVEDVQRELTKIEGYSRCEVSNTTWQDRWFKTQRGVEMKLFI